MHVQSQRLPKWPPMFVWERFLKNCLHVFPSFALNILSAQRTVWMTNVLFLHDVRRCCWQLRAGSVQNSDFTRFQSSCSDVAVLNCLDFQRSSISCIALYCTAQTDCISSRPPKLKSFLLKSNGIEVSGQRKILQESPMHQAREKPKAGLLCRYLYIAAMLEPICWTSLKIRCRCCNWPWKASCSLSTLFSLFRVACFSEWRQESSLLLKLASFQLEPMQSVENKRGSDPSGLGSLHIVLQDIFLFCAFFRYLLSGKLPVSFPGL